MSLPYWLCSRGESVITDITIHPIQSLILGMPVIADPPLEWPGTGEFPRPIMVSEKRLKLSMTNHIYRGAKGRTSGEADEARKYREMEKIKWERRTCKNCQKAKTIVAS